MLGFDLSHIGPAFENPVLDSQRVFRTIMRAMAHPGSVIRVDGLPDAPPPLNPAANAVCLALADIDTPLWLDVGSEAVEVIAHLGFHTGCPVVENSEQATFVLVTDASATPSLSQVRLGTDERPDLSATLVIQVTGLSQDSGWVLSGPGIDATQHLAVDAPGADLEPFLRENHALFPCGVDVIFCAPDRLAALPRTTRIEG